MSTSPRSELFPIERLSALWQSSERFAVLDTDSRSPAQFDAVRAAWTATPHAHSAARLLHYVALCGPASEGPLPDATAPTWHRALPGFLRTPLDHGTIQLTTARGEPERLLKDLAATFDAILLSSPAPSNAAALARVSRPGTLLTAHFRDTPTEAALERAGFKIAPISSGFEARFRTEPTRKSPPTTVPQTREAIILGAGLAGSAAASCLARRGWTIHVLEREQAPAMAASGNLAAVFSPMLSLDDGIAAQLSRSSYLTLLQELLALGTSSTPVHWNACGVLQLARTPTERERMRAIVDRHQYPADFVRFLDCGDTSAEAGHSLPAASWLFPHAGWLNPPSLCRARLAHPAIHLHTGSPVLRLQSDGNLWRALGTDDALLAEAPVVILANGYKATHLAQATHLRFKKVRGQVSHLPAHLLPHSPRVLTGDGYLTPPTQGHCSLGATYDFDSHNPLLEEASHHTNLAHLHAFFPDTTPHIPTSQLDGRVGFRSLTPDRLPLIGALPAPPDPHSGSPSNLISRVPGIFTLLGLGSRGVVWSALAGEILASQIAGEPAPVPLSILRAVDPVRFLFPNSNSKAKAKSTRRSHTTQ